MTAPYMPLFIAEYLADTAHLSAAEHGAYLLLIMNYWQRGKPLPADDRKLARIARMSDADWQDARDTLAEFFQEEDGEWRHGRIERELAVASEKSAKAKASARASVAARQASAQRPLNERSTDAELLGKDGEEKTEKKSSLRSDSAQARPDAGEALLLEAGVQPETIREWKLTRKAKRAGPITPLVAKGQIREAAAADMTPEAATLLCIERGWQAFRAEFVRDRRQTGPPRANPKPTAGEAAAELEAMFGNPHDPDHSREPSTTVPRLAYSASR